MPVTAETATETKLKRRRGLWLLLALLPLLVLLALVGLAPAFGGRVEGKRLGFRTGVEPLSAWHQGFGHEHYDVPPPTTDRPFTPGAVTNWYLRLGDWHWYLWKFNPA